MGASQTAHILRDAIPDGGLLEGLDWRITTSPFPLGEPLFRELDALGRVLLRFYQATNLLYRQSIVGKQPGWIAELLDQGKPESIVALQRAAKFKNEIPRVIRPDILLTDDGFSITELDSVPGGIGLTAWLNQTYAGLGEEVTGKGVVGGKAGMLEGFSRIFGAANQVHIVVSEESSTYLPEMRWMTGQLGSRFTLSDSRQADFASGSGVYRFFELFDAGNVANSRQLFELAQAGEILLTPPPKAFLEEKLLFALLWNRNLYDFWRRELGDGFLRRMLSHVPYSWVLDPSPLPPHAAIPHLNLTGWQQLKQLSQRERDLVLKVSGFSEDAWGSRGVHIGSDLSREEWSVAVDKAIGSFGRNPYILQRYHKPRTVEVAYFDFKRTETVTMSGRVRLCPYYFVRGEHESLHADLCGVLATICPADKKIIHGMSEAILAPCCR